VERKKKEEELVNKELEDENIKDLKLEERVINSKPKGIIN
jgi:hypothetical protein